MTMVVQKGFTTLILAAISIFVVLGLVAANWLRNDGEFIALEDSDVLDAESDALIHKLRLNSTNKQALFLAYLQATAELPFLCCSGRTHTRLARKARTQMLNDRILNGIPSQ